MELLQEPSINRKLRSFYPAGEELTVCSQFPRMTLVILCVFIYVLLSKIKQDIPHIKQISLQIVYLEMCKPTFMKFKFRAYV